MNDEKNLTANIKIRKKNSDQSKLLLKVKSVKNNRKKKQLFDELSFVESHQETFYFGLNENVNCGNPIQAKVIEGNLAEELAKDWVFNPLNYILLLKQISFVFLFLGPS